VRSLPMLDSEFRDYIERVREATDIVAVVGRFVELNGKGRCSCPFHRENTPSFHVNPAGRFFKCFGCGVGGDVFRFVELAEKKPFLDVLTNLAREAGIPPPDPSPGARQRAEERRTVEDILGATAGFHHQALTPEVRAYLVNDRGFTEETIARFQIGFAAGGLRRHLLDDSGFPEELCVRAGVLRREADGRVTEFLHGRITFPNLGRGRVVHMTGRAVGDRQPKYLHLPGEIEYLYNEDALRSEGVCLAEGAPDCISAVQAGFPAVAILGTGAFENDCAARFSRCETIYLCLDADDAGREATLTVRRALGQRAGVVSLPEGQDLNDYLQSHAPEEFAQLLASAPGMITHQLTLIPSDTPLTQLPRALAPVIEQLAETAEAYLRGEIKPRFALTVRDLEAYRKRLKELRREGVAVRGAAAIGSAEAEPIAVFDGLVDLVEHEGAPAFLLVEGDDLLLRHEIELDGKTYCPPERAQIPWLLPSGECVRECFAQGREAGKQQTDGGPYDDLREYHHGISEPPDDEYYDLLASWVLHTHLLEGAQYSPEICLFAVPERGKTRTGKGLSHVAYRGIHVESLRDPYLVRVSNDLHASLFFDVRDLWRKALKNGSEDILLHRFEKGATVPRVMYPDRGAHRDIVYYSIFGPTVIATNEGVDRILETRAIQINMPSAMRQFEDDIAPEVALPLKERLLAFRARHMGQPLPLVPKPASGRLGDILKPLLQIVRLVRPERESHFLELVSQLEDQRLSETAGSLEAEVIRTVADLSDQVQGGILPVKLITDTLNEDRPERHRLT
jgi:DNA primase catalytic core